MCAFFGCIYPRRACADETQVFTSGSDVLVDDSLRGLRSSSCLGLCLAHLSRVEMVLLPDDHHKWDFSDWVPVVLLRKMTLNWGCCVFREILTRFLLAA